MSSHSRADLLRYKIAPKYPLSGPFHHSGLRRNPEVAGRFVAIISFLHTPVRPPGPIGQDIRAAADSASQCREIRSGPVLRVLCHCQPALLSILKPGSIQKRSAYQLAPASPGAWPVNMVHGLLLLSVPDHNQGATAFHGCITERGPTANPSGIRTGNEGPRRQAAASLGTESSVFRVPHVWMPALRSWPGAGSGRTAQSPSSPPGPPGPAPATVRRPGPSMRPACWRA